MARVHAYIASPSLHLPHSLSSVLFLSDAAAAAHCNSRSGHGNSRLARRSRGIRQVEESGRRKNLGGRNHYQSLVVCSLLISLHRRSKTRFLRCLFAVAFLYSFFVGVADPSLSPHPSPSAGAAPPLVNVCVYLWGMSAHGRLSSRHHHVPHARLRHALLIILCPFSYVVRKKK